MAHVVSSCFAGLPPFLVLCGVQVSGSGIRHGWANAWLDRELPQTSSGTMVTGAVSGRFTKWGKISEYFGGATKFRVYYIIYIYILHLMYQDIIHLSKTLQHTCIGFGCSFAAQVEGEGPEKEQLAKFFACADAWHARAVQAGDRSDLRCFWVYYWVYWSLVHIFSDRLYLVPFFADDLPTLPIQAPSCVWMPYSLARTNLGIWKLLFAGCQPAALSALSYLSVFQPKPRLSETPAICDPQPCACSSQVMPAVSVFLWIIINGVRFCRYTSAIFPESVWAQGSSNSGGL